MPDDGSSASKLRKNLLAMDESRTIGACEAASNLLGYSHWSTSSTVLRISTLPYLKISSANESTAMRCNLLKCMIN